VVGTRRLGHRRTAAVAHAVALSMPLGLMIVPLRSQSADQTEPVSSRADAKTPLVEYNAGTVAYRAGRFAQATQAFKQSIDTAPASDAKRLADQEDAYYNLGNALYRAGQQFEKSAPQQALQKWTDALKAYDTALQLRRNDADSKFNRDFVQRKIDALRQPPDRGGGGGGGGGNGGNTGQGQPPNNDQGQRQPPPPGQGQSQGQPPPRGQGQSEDQPPAQSQSQPQRQPSPPGQDQSQGQPPPGAPAPTEAATQGATGQMSPEEARELLDSAKSDEHHSLLVPSGPRDPDPDKPFKNW